MVEEDVLLSLLPDRLDLPRGRSALSKSAVEASRRGRILQATLDEVAESGYHATTVAAITKRARVSRTSFYDAFADKEDAFAAAHWDASDLAVTRVWEPALTRPDLGFDDRIAAVLSAYIDVLEAARSFTICFFVEILAGGERLALQREEMLDRHVKILHELARVSSASDSTIALPDHDVLRGLIGAFDELVARRVRSRRHDESLDLGLVVAPVTHIVMAVMHDT
ncbi:MAG: helix-turn-helix domain-containing protein [Aeromicrobium sp.]